jgi:glycosyltransferase involved in cell wall biosynthesis
MKISLVCPASLPATQFGGIMFLGVEIATELAKKSHNVTIFTTDLDFANNASTFNKNLSRKESINNFIINRTHVWFSYKLFYVNLGMYFQMKNEKHDVIHTIGVRSFQSLIAAIISKKNKIPLIISDQGGLTTHPDLKKNSITKKIMYKIQNPLIKFIINQTTKIIVPNEYEKKIFLEYTTNEKIVIIKNGINLDELYQSKINFKVKYEMKNNFILFVGRFNKVKGVDILLEAWKLIEKKVQNTKLVIMGVDFGFESEMYKMIDDLKINDSVIVLKNPPREDILAAYSACKFLVLPSRWELSPLTPLEGFGFKKPTISTTAHGIPHTITNKKNSILVEPDNSLQLSKAISELLANENLISTYGNAGYNLVQEICNSKKMSENILKIYEQILRDD